MAQIWVHYIRKRSLSPVVGFILIIFCICCLSFGGIRATGSETEAETAAETGAETAVTAEAGGETEAEIRAEASTETRAEASTETRAEAEAITEAGTEQETEEETEPIPFPDFIMDLTFYMEENEDVQGMIYIPVLNLVYPVVWREFENDYYMEHDLLQEEDPKGCIMIDGWNTPDLGDCMTLIHGHNMADGSMFGSLKRFLEDSSLAQREPYIYYYYMDDAEICAYRYQIISYYTTDIYDKTYDQPEIYVYYHGPVWDSYSKETQQILEVFRMNWYSCMLQDLQDRAVQQLPIPKLDNQPHLLLLSTCYGAVHSDKRLVVGCVRR